MERVTLEIRAAAGGEEAGLFSQELMRMYQRYAQRRGWQVSQDEMTLQISGQGVFNELRHEAGVHRVQRIPATERHGRIHTSTVSVAVLVDQSANNVSIDPGDLEIDAFRASGAGGQHVNKTSSAIRITHNPSGLVITCQDQRSQHQNKAKALDMLKSKLEALEQSRFEQSVSSERRSQVGTGERSEKIRTYNFPHNRVTDHRLNKSWQNLGQVLDGNLKKMIKALMQPK